ncbi:MAG: MarR family winged helix-turn-helix transcriptional regulator [Jatrophihabitantaceae bacterium]
MSALPADTPALNLDLVDVADTFTRLMRTFVRTRTQVLAAAAHDVEWSAHMVLKALDNDGPLRSSRVADLLQADPSTVSRQVAALVRDGLVERRADPEDGRACLLVLTDKAADVLKRHDQIRHQHFDRMLAGWNERDLRRFSTLLTRFTEDFESASLDWLSGLADKQRGSTEGKN